MAQHDYVIANGSGAAVRSDLNNALAAIATNNSGSTEPTTTYAYQFWADTSAGLLKLRNGANNAWITLRELDGTLTIEDGTVSAPGLAFAADLNTGFWRPGTDQLAISTNGIERVAWGTTEVVFNDASNNYDFRIEGDTNANLFFVDASADAIGIGTSSPDGTAHVHTASAGTITPNSSADDLVVENSGAGGISILTPDGSNGSLFFGSPSDAVGAAARWNYTSGEFSIGSDKSGGVTKLTSGDGTTAVTIDSSQRVGIGTATPGNFVGNVNVVVGSAATSTTTAAVTIYSGTATYGGLYFADGTVGDQLYRGYVEYKHDVDALTLGSGGSERVRIDSSGRLLVGTSSANTNYYISSTATTPQIQLKGLTSSTAAMVIHNDTGTPSAAAPGRLHLVAGGQGTGGSGTTNLASGDITGSIHFSGLVGDGSSNSRHYNVAIVRASVDGTPSYTSTPGRIEFLTTASGATSPTERMRITQDGSILFNKTSASVSTAGTETLSSGQTNVTVNGAECMNINRLTSDGNLINFRQDTTAEGSISVSGTTVSYNGAHLSRWSQLSSGEERTEILRGSVLSNIDEMCEWGEEANEQLNRMKVSDVEGDKNVSGVFQAWDDDDDTYTNDFYCAMTGDFIIRIGAGVTVERGDLLMSAGDGTAKPQDDDIIRSKTIAKVTSTNVSCTYDDGSYCVPCVLMAC